MKIALKTNFFNAIPLGRKKKNNFQVSECVWGGG